MGTAEAGAPQTPDRVAAAGVPTHVSSEIEKGPLPGRMILTDGRYHPLGRQGMRYHGVSRAAHGFDVSASLPASQGDAVTPPKRVPGGPEVFTLPSQDQAPRPAFSRVQSARGPPNAVPAASTSYARPLSSLPGARTGPAPAPGPGAAEMESLVAAIAAENRRAMTASRAGRDGEGGSRRGGEGTEGGREGKGQEEGREKSMGFKGGEERVGGEMVRYEGLENVGVSDGQWGGGVREAKGRTRGNVGAGNEVPEPEKGRSPKVTDGAQRLLLTHESPPRASRLPSNWPVRGTIGRISRSTTLTQRPLTPTPLIPSVPRY